MISLPVSGPRAETPNFPCKLNPRRLAWNLWLGDYLSVGESEAVESSLRLALSVDRDPSLWFRLGHLNLVRPRAHAESSLVSAAGELRTSIPFLPSPTALIFCLRVNLLQLPPRCKQGVPNVVLKKGIHLDGGHLGAYS